MLAWTFFKHYLFSPRAGSLVRRISWLSIFGIGVAITAFIVVLCVMESLNLNIRERTWIEPHVFVALNDAKKISDLEISPVFDKLKMLNNSDSQNFTAETQDIILRTPEGYYRGAVARGLTPEALNFTLDQLRKADMKISGKAQREYLETHPLINSELHESEVILGSDLARLLGVFEGDVITAFTPESLLLPPTESPHFEKIKVARILNTGLNDIDSQYMFYIQGKVLTTFQNASKKLTLESWLSDPYKADDYKNALKNFSNVSVETWMDRNSALFSALKLERLMIGTFLFLAALIASFSIVTVLALLISQKRKEIAMLRAVGLSRLKAQHLFSQIGMILSTCGIGGGLVVGTLISFLLEKKPLHILPDIYTDSEVSAHVNWWLILCAALVGTLIAYIGSNLPARSAGEIEPSELLK